MAVLLIVCSGLLTGCTLSPFAPSRLLSLCHFCSSAGALWLSGQFCPKCVPRLASPTRLSRRGRCSYGCPEKCSAKVNTALLALSPPQLVWPLALVGSCTLLFLLYTTYICTHLVCTLCPGCIAKPPLRTPLLATGGPWVPACLCRVAVSPLCTPHLGVPGEQAMAAL